MKVNLTCVMLVLESLQNPDIRKNDLKSIKIVVRHNCRKLPQVYANPSNDIKQQLRRTLFNIVGTDVFSLEQVYALGDKKYMSADGDIDIIYLAIINGTQISKIAADYKLIDISIQNNIIKIGEQKYHYRTIEKIGHGIEYFFDTDAPDISCDKMLIEILTAWKYLRSRLDFTDIIFKFMPSDFTLEDVRQVYEIVSQQQVDKSNFRKKITKYCDEIPGKTTHRGHRPGKIYQYVPKVGDTWL